MLLLLMLLLLLLLFSNAVVNNCRGFSNILQTLLYPPVQGKVGLSPVTVSDAPALLYNFLMIQYTAEPAYKRLQGNKDFCLL